MNTRNITIFLFVVGVIFLAIGVGIGGGTFDQAETVSYNGLPPNYKILCNETGDKFIVEMPAGTLLYNYYGSEPYSPFDNYEDAVKRAWEQYNFVMPPSDTVHWKDCGGVK